jgi:hypothetical protein
MKPNLFAAHEREAKQPKRGNRFKRWRRMLTSRRFLPRLTMRRRDPAANVADVHCFKRSDVRILLIQQ